MQYSADSAFFWHIPPSITFLGVEIVIIERIDYSDIYGQR